MTEVKPKTAKQHNIEQGVVGIDNKTLVFNEGSSRAEQWVMIQVEKIKAEARLSTAREIFQEIERIITITYIDGMSIPVIDSGKLASLKSRYEEEK